MIKINGVLWRLYFVPPYSPSLYRNDGSLTIGMCDNNTKSIYVCDSLNEFMTKKVLCHELVHASMFSYGVRLSTDQEELVADLIATYGEEIIDKANLIFSKLSNNYVA